MARRYTKADIEFHGTSGNPFRDDGSPAVNVKVYASMRDGWRQFEEYRAAEGYDPAFTPEWLDRKVASEYGIDPADAHEIENATGQYLEGWWQMACEHQLETAQEDIAYFFEKTPAAYDLGLNGSARPAAECHLAGRSGGWLYIGDKNGQRIWRPADTLHWDAIMVAAWGRFEKACKAYAAEVPYQTLDLIYHNVFESQREREEAIVREMVA